MNVGIITSPYLLEAGVTPLSNLVHSLSFSSDNIYVITGNSGVALFKDDTVHLYLIEHKRELNPSVKLLKYFRANLKISYKMVELSKDVHFWIIFMGEKPLFIPLLIAKLLRKKTIIISSGSLLKNINTNINSQKTFSQFIMTNIIVPANHMLADKIVVYSIRIIDEYFFNKHKNKILINHEHFLDFDLFKRKIKLDERDFVVGYIGRLSEEKGILNFVKSIRSILKRENDATFLICGDGDLMIKIRKFLDKESLTKSVKLAGWIQHSELPDYMNILKLIVLPSYTEGLPNIMLEAMACGTPVLATPVGAIPDIIKDGETGFLMENNSPECIAANVIRALEHPDLEGVAERARATVAREFTLEKAVERWRVVLEEVGDGRR
jgi:glycosyltransferase involved in cell wall biosynthesis